ncbi:imidazoleglycerol-phosphate dehydratase [Virgibacillus phasianinus]|uniref:Imidazoleglycerol-phosphate dehydratase n=1 Tax=Virgibacillus phasianinus TaxID=2017483 RepID=A0A220U7M5_9BACI|nr:imidazoleglycerol-phosphate dehydratase HisB [Virgibacillus phasianinus]ASK64284.1 imidazoleglycerol-phosphate dehydratase [Virgibacillus phasianinus]
MRSSSIQRKTNETAINAEFSIDGTGTSSIDSGIGFLNHMLTLMNRHGLFDLNLTCAGDLDVDQHHSVEDIGIVLGQAVNQALGTKEGINRYATITTPMDEARSTISIDISGRSFLVYQVDGLKDKVGDFDTELVEEFFLAFVRHANLTLHIVLDYGKNSHHMIESIFKGFGRALDTATGENPRIQGVPSTKGKL